MHSLSPRHQTHANPKSTCLGVRGTPGHCRAGAGPQGADTASCASPLAVSDGDSSQPPNPAFRPGVAQAHPPEESAQHNEFTLGLPTAWYSLPDGSFSGSKGAVT